MFVRGFTLFLCACIACAHPAASAPRDGGSGEYVVGIPQVIDGDTLNFPNQDVEVRLFGVDAPEARAECNGTAGPWACGTWATEQLRNLVSGREVRCEQRAPPSYERMVASCKVGDDEINAILVLTGAGFACPQYSQDYVSMESEAKVKGLGIWQGKNDLPMQCWTDEAKAELYALLPRCMIKGNIGSKNELIYHLPGGQYYDKTRIEVENGERWFCSAAEAEAAGWRAARR